jgi:K+-transporting ATPase ATPase C chain
MNQRTVSSRPPVETGGGEADHADLPRIGMLAHLKTSVLATLVLAVIVSGLYPAVVWALAQALFREKANGSLITDARGNVVGSRLIGQTFGDAKYFHPRPSAAGSGYDATASGGSNLGPTSSKLINGTTKPTTQPNPRGGDPIPGPDAVDYDGIKLRVLKYCTENGIPFDAKPPTDRFKNASGELDEARVVKAFVDEHEPLVITPKQTIPADAVTASGSGLDPHISVANATFQAARVAATRKVSVNVVEKLIAEHTEGPTFGLLGEPRVNVLLLNLSLDKLNAADAALSAARFP